MHSVQFPDLTIVTCVLFFESNICSVAMVIAMRFNTSVCNELNNYELYLKHYASYYIRQFKLNEYFFVKCKLMLHFGFRTMQTNVHTPFSLRPGRFSVILYTVNRVKHESSFRPISGSDLHPTMVLEQAETKRT